MKKIIILFVALFVTTNMTFASEGLYTIQNVKKDSVRPYVESVLYNANYAINKKDPYYAVNSSDNTDYITIILQQTGNDILYYYNSSKNKKADKNILKAIKNAGMSYYETDDMNYMSVFANQAQEIASGVVKNYSFDIWNNTQPAVAVSSSTDDDTALKGKIVQIAKGTTIDVYLQTPINTASAKAGDSVTAVLTNDLVYNGYTIAPQGSILSGTLSKARSATYGSRNGRVVINFTDLTTIDNKTYQISTEAIDFTVTNDGKLAKSAKNVATGAIIGAIGGLIIGAITQDAHLGRAVLIGTATGATAGTVSAVAERGVDAEIPIYTELEVKLTKPFKAVFY